MGWGTANAKTFTLSFVVYSSLTGTFGGTVQSGTATRCYAFTYSIPAANTWTTISVTITGDTTAGGWNTNNTSGLILRFGLGVGSSASTAAGVWGAGNFSAATGATSVVGTSGATFFLTGVQLEKGPTATAFDYRDYGRELIMCQRYAQVYGGVGYETLSNAYAFTGLDIRGIINLPTTMRAAPTGVFTGTWRAINGSTQYASTAQVISEASTKNASFSFTVSGASAGQGGWVSAFNDSNARLILSAEL